MIVGIATAMTISSTTQSLLRRRTLLDKIEGVRCPIATEVGTMKRNKLVEKTKLVIYQNRVADLTAKAKQAGAKPREILKLTFRG